MRTWLSFFVVLFFAFPAFADSMTEDQKIDALLDTVGSPDVVFIRDGEEHDGDYARDHLVRKMKEVKDVKTAEDFIIKIASKSSETGKPYYVKLKDGSQVESSVWLHQQLKEIENTELME